MKMEMGKNKGIIMAAAIAVFAIFLLINPDENENGVSEDYQISELSIVDLTGSNVLEKLSKYVDVGNARVAQITNIEELWEKYGALFKDAKNGDYIVETDDSIRVYDYENDEIINEFQFQRISLA